MRKATSFEPVPFFVLSMLRGLAISLDNTPRNDSFVVSYNYWGEVCSPLRFHQETFLFWLPEVSA